jgi:ribosomal protein S18 acetylase RimI-like enzyme
VAHLQELAVRPDAQHCGYAHRLLAAFEERATEAGVHLCEFWTDDLESSALLGALGWQTVLRREHYVGDRTWVLLERRLQKEP